VQVDGVIIGTDTLSFTMALGFYRTYTREYHTRSAGARSALRLNAHILFSPGSGRFPGQAEARQVLVSRKTSVETGFQNNLSLSTRALSKPRRSHPHAAKKCAGKHHPAPITDLRRNRFEFIFGGLQ